MSDHGYDPDEPLHITRRTALAVGAGATAAGLVPFRLHAQVSSETPRPEAGPTTPVVLEVNGETVALEIDARASLLDLLRDRLALTGTKKGCDHGQCGACTVQVDGRPALSCLTMAAKADGRQILTIEGLASADGLHPVQQAFIDQDALQCGYCTPGQIMSAVACIAGGFATDPQSIREFMSGNLCRCGAYSGIVAAIEQAAGTGRG